MAYIVSVGAVLGSGQTGQAIGYKLIDITGTTVTAFTTTDVVETSVPGNYTVTGGISVPDSFQGRIVWGTSGSDMAEVWVNPAEVEANFQADAVLKRGVSNTEGSAEMNSLTEIILAALHSSVNGTTLTIKKTNGTTTFSTHTVETSDDATPITGVN
jgi:hypothetical protein